MLLKFLESTPKLQPRAPDHRKNLGCDQEADWRLRR